MCHQPSSNGQKNRDAILLAVRREECVEEYEMYAEAEGRFLNSGDLTKIDRPLYRRILRRFGSWKVFMANVSLRRNRRGRFN
jgi:hypothetical protein